MLIFLHKVFSLGSQLNFAFSRTSPFPGNKAQSIAGFPGFSFVLEKVLGNICSYLKMSYIIAAFL